MPRKPPPKPPIDRETELAVAGVGEFFLVNVQDLEDRLERALDRCDELGAEVRRLRAELAAK